jgi:hypothetical protein
MLALAVRGTFSPARPWRPAVVARLSEGSGLVTEKLPTPCLYVMDKRPAIKLTDNSPILIQRQS